MGARVFPEAPRNLFVPPNKRWWFEEGSQFRAGLDVALKARRSTGQFAHFCGAGPTPFMTETMQRESYPAS